MNINPLLVFFDLIGFLEDPWRRHYLNKDSLNDQVVYTRTLDPKIRHRFRPLIDETWEPLFSKFYFWLYNFFQLIKILFDLNSRWSM